MRKKSEQQNNSSKNKTSSKKEEKQAIDESKSQSRAIKKTKSGLAKIKSQIQHTVNAKKIIQLIRKSTRTIPHLLTKQQSKALLPKLQKIVFPQLKNEQSLASRAKFDEIEGQLTHSMVVFKKNVDMQKNDLWAIDMQTQKCYKMMPQFYFKQHMNSQQLTRNLTLTKNHSEMRENVLVLGDYLDQVQFNINQQANAKIKMFMNFILCMNSIQDLVSINTKKLSTTRKHIGILRDIIVSRSIRINQQRLKKENIQQALRFLHIFKKLKHLQGKLNIQISLGNFIPHDSKSKLGALFHEYCQIHNQQLKKFCCKTSKNLCRYWDITYFVEKGFQDNIMKMIKSYICQLIICQRQVENYKKALIGNKKNFMTTPSNFSNGDTSFNHLDQSYEVDAFQHVQLITKIHIEKQIIALFEQGMYKYSFSTENLQNQLKQFLARYLNTFLRQILSSIQSESRLTLKDLNENQDSFIDTEKCRQKVQKMSWSQFDKMIEMVLVRFQYMTIRQISLVQKLLQKVEEIKQQFMERYQVISGYLAQLVSMILMQTDLYIALVLKSRMKQPDKSITLFKSKQQIFRQFDNECDSMKKLVKHCKKWLQHIQSLQKTYLKSSQQLAELAKSNKIGKTAKNDNWAPKVALLKGTLVKNNYELFHKTLTARNLKQKLDQDSWQIIQVKTDIYNDLGYIIGGRFFLVQQERIQKDSLSKSLLMDRSQSQIQKNQPVQPQYKKQQYSSRFKINPSYITLANLKFKIVFSTEFLIKSLRKLLELYDDLSECEGDKKADLHGKITEIILMYNQFVKDLILKGEALKLGRIKAKTITAKYLVIAFIQMQVIEVIFTGQIIEKRIGFTKQQCSVMSQRIVSSQNQIKKKYQKILQLRIMDTIDSINYKDNWVEGQNILSLPKNFHSSLELFQDLIVSSGDYKSFLDIDPSWVAQLLNKINKQPKSKQLKTKCFGNLVEQFQPLKQYVPRIFVALKSTLN